MKNIYLSILSVVLLFPSLAMSQVWTPIYSYNIQEFWDAPRVDVSANGVIAVSFQTIKSGRPLEVSTDGGTTWNMVDADFQRAFVGFDSQDRMYMVSEKKVQNVSLTYMDSLYYSSDQGASIQAVADHPAYGFDRHSFYIDPQDNFYCLSPNSGPNNTQQLDLYSAGQYSTAVPSGFIAGSDNLRSIIKLSNGNYVTSSYNGGISYSTDGGQTWVDSQHDSILGAATFAIFAEANNATLFLGGPMMVQCSDGGETWGTSNLGQTWINGVRKAGNGNLYAAGEFSSPSIWESSDNGATWVGLQNQPVGGFYDWDLSNGHIYVAFKDSVLYSTPVSGGGVGIQENSIQNHVVQVYPNPTASEITIHNDEYSGQKWYTQILDVNAKLVFQAESYDKSMGVDRSALPQVGLYIVKAYTLDNELIGETKLIKFK